MNYNVNWNDLVVQLLPPRYRKARRAAWLRALIKPIKTLWNNFLAFRISIRWKLTWNGQTIVLERLLNDTFPNPGNGIYIENINTLYNQDYDWFDNEAQAVDYEFFDSEAQPPEYDYYQTAYNVQNNFIVWVPVTLVYDQSVMIALLNYYKISGTNYSIMTY